MSTDPAYVYMSDHDDDRRAVVYVADWQETPDGDGYGYVMRRTWSRHGSYRWEVVHADPVDGDARRGARAAGELAERLTDAYRCAGDYGTGDPDAAVDTVLARTAADWHTFRSHVDRSGDDYLVMFTAAHLTEWYGADGADDVADPARRAAADWQAWLDGEVYRVTVERRVRWQPDAAGYDDRETWESVDDDPGYGDVYGTDYAESAARELLAEYLDTHAA